MKYGLLYEFGLAEPSYYTSTASYEVMSDQPTRQELATKQWETLATVPVEDTLPQPDPAGRLHALVKEPTPRLRWLRAMDQIPSAAWSLVPLAVIGGCTAAVLSPFGAVWSEAAGNLATDLSLPPTPVPYDVAVGTMMGTGLAVLAGPHLDLYQPSLATDGKIGTIIATDGDGTLSTDLITTAPLDVIAGEITDAVDRQICYQAHQITLAEMLGCDPAEFIKNEIHGAEITWRVDDSHDQSIKGPTIYDILANGDNSLPTNKIGHHLLNAKVPVAVQSVCQARLPQQYRIDRKIDDIRRKESDKPALRHIERFPPRSIEYRDIEDLSNKDQKRIEKLRQVRGESLFDINIRIIGLIQTEEERRQLKKTVRRVAEALKTISNEYVTPEIDWYDGEGGVLNDNADLQLLRRFNNMEIETTPAYKAGIIRNKIRRNLVLDADTVWSVLLMTGDGTPAVRDAHDTVPPSQRLDQRPGYDVQDWLIYDDEQDGET